MVRAVKKNHKTIVYDIMNNIINKIEEMRQFGDVSGLPALLHK